MKRARNERPPIEDGEITNTQILDELKTCTDELGVLKEEVDSLKEEKTELTRQLSEAMAVRDKYKAHHDKRKERSKKMHLDDATDSLKADYAELKHEFQDKKDKWKQEKNKWVDRVERLEVKVEALKEENGKLVVQETRLRNDFERRLLSSTSEARYKDQIKQLEDSLKNSEVAFRAADSLQREQEAITESVKASMKHMEDVMKVKDDKIAGLQIAAARAAQQLAEANALDHAAHQKSLLEKNLHAAHAKFHDQMKVDAQKLTLLQADLMDKMRTINEHKNSTQHTTAKLQMLENNEQALREELARVSESARAFGDEKLRTLQTEIASLTQQLAFRKGGPPNFILGMLETMKVQNFNLNAEVQRLRSTVQEYEAERIMFIDDIQALQQQQQGKFGRGGHGGRGGFGPGGFNHNNRFGGMGGLSYNSPNGNFGFHGRGGGRRGGFGFGGGGTGANGIAMAMNNRGNGLVSSPNEVNSPNSPPISNREVSPNSSSDGINNNYNGNITINLDGSG